MSRTDKDVPNWVRAEYYVASHSPYCPYGLNLKSHARPCDLPPEPVRQRDGRRWTGGCAWQAKWDRLHDYDRPNSKLYRLTKWCAPERAHVRDFCRRAARDPYDPDLIEPVRQHRHSSYKGWWW